MGAGRNEGWKEEKIREGERYNEWKKGEVWRMECREGGRDRGR